MGLSSLPAPSEGVLCAIFGQKTARTVSILKRIVCLFLHIVGFYLSSSAAPSSVESSSDFVVDNDETTEFFISPPDAFIEEFRNRFPATRFDALSDSQDPEQDCSVCLTQFEPDSEVNLICCGHLFHKACLEKWLDYWNITCPNCRSSLILDKELCYYW